MCGIAGFSGSGSGLGAGLKRAQESLRHRGPDGHGDYYDQDIGLAHTRLSIIDLTGGAQPLISDCGNAVLVANGEIYNYLELRTELEQLGCRFTTHSDSEVILQGFLHWGESVLSRLEGMYAFALYDRREQRILLARDPLGMKPLFIGSHGGATVFASEIKGILAVTGQRAAVDPMGVAQYFQCQHSLGPTTSCQGIERLLPGEALWVSGGKITRRWRHWSVESVPQVCPDNPLQVLDDLMMAVVEQHLRSDVPIGLFLSGGVDSTVLLGLMDRLGKKHIQTFSLGFPQSSVGDELDTANTLARHYQTEHRVITPDGDKILGRLVGSTWAADDLMRDSASLPTSVLAEAAGADIKVVFSGEGGDEAFAGYGRYRTGVLERRLKGMLYPGTGGFRARGDLRGGLVSSLLSSKLVPHARQWRKPLQHAWAGYPGQWTDLMRMQAMDLTHALPDNLLVKADRMLMAHGVEGRMPFVDRRVIELGLGLPDALKNDSKTGKKLVRQWAKSFMPADHLDAKKRGFHVPINDWWQGDRLIRLGRELRQNSAVREWLRPKGVEALLARQGRRSDVGGQLMAILQFAIWHRLFVEGDGERPDNDIDPLTFLQATQR